MTPYLDDGDVVLHLGDCVEVMAAMEPESVDAVVCDPPYGLEFMGKEWDALGGDRRQVGDATFHAPHLETNTYGGAKIRYGGSAYGNKDAPRQMQEWHQAWASEALRVLRPGGHLLAFGGTRTFHRLTCAIEDAGFEVRDCLSWLYGSGFPKSLSVDKAIDKAAGAERERRPGVGMPSGTNRYMGGVGHSPTAPLAGLWQVDAPITPEAAAWQGWHTALKPGWEPIIIARKPLSGTVAANVLAHGTGALNVDGCRVGYDPDDLATRTARTGAHAGEAYGHNGSVPYSGGEVAPPNPAGRWPANVVLDEEAAARLDAEVGELTTNPGTMRRDYTEKSEGWGNIGLRKSGSATTGDTGGPSRFFYTAKASSAERDGASHPTVKPLALMRWLVRLVTPPGGVVLDPFAGSGTTGLACREEGFRCVLIEREEEYAAMAAHRLRQLSLLGGAA